MDRAQLLERLRDTFRGELQVRSAAFAEGMKQPLARQEPPAPGATQALERDALKDLAREVHSLRGAARSAACPVVEEACRLAERLLEQALRQDCVLSPADLDLLSRTADALLDASTRLERDAPLEDSPLADLTGALAAAAGH